MDDKILHQDDVEDVIDDVSPVRGLVAIADLAAPSATYVEAEALASRNKINAILAQLRLTGTIAT